MEPVYGTLITAARTMWKVQGLRFTITGIENMSRNDCGLMKLCRVAYSPPASPPMQAPVAKANSLNLKVGTPINSAASSSSRVASQARPTRLFLTKMSAKITTMQAVRPIQ